MILDTTFLVDFDPNRRKKICGAAHEFLKKHLEVRFAVTFTIAGEGGGPGVPRAATVWHGTAFCAHSGFWGTQPATEARNSRKIVSSWERLFRLRGRQKTIDLTSEPK